MCALDAMPVYARVSLHVCCVFAQCGWECDTWKWDTMVGITFLLSLSLPSLSPLSPVSPFLLLTLSLSLSHSPPLSLSFSRHSYNSQVLRIEKTSAQLGITCIQASLCTSTRYILY